MENICYVIWKFKSPDNFVNMGGAEKQLLGYIKQLKSSEKNISIITRKTDCDEKIECYSDNVTIHRIKTTNIRFVSMIIFMIGLFFLIYKLNRRNKFDIIHLPLPDIYILVIYLLRRILKIPVITMVAGDELFPQKYQGLWYVDRLIVRSLIKKADGIQTLNKVSFKAAEKLQIDKKKIFLIYCGVDIPVKDRNYDVLTNNIVYVGAMRFFPEKQKREIKNLDYLIDSFNILLEYLPNQKLILVGDGNYRKNLEEKVSKLNLENKVIFTGYQTDVQYYLNMADIFVNPSLIEGMPNAVLEAMASGVYVLCSNIHAHRFIIKNNKSGVLFDNTKKKDFVNKILDFYNNIKKSERIAKNGRKSIQEKFAMNKIIEQILLMYKEITILYRKEK